MGRSGLESGDASRLVPSTNDENSDTVDPCGHTRTRRFSWRHTKMRRFSAKKHENMSRVTKMESRKKSCEESRLKRPLGPVQGVI